VALWRSFADFDERCSMRTWVFRVAHNTGVTHVVRERRRRKQLIGLEEVEEIPAPPSIDNDRQQRLNLLLAMIRQLKPIDRQVILSYLEDMDAASIAEVTGLSPNHVATKIHRIKKILSRRFRAAEKA
jgi:RNA polymerase sigma-70 factor (ECF subfamily)